MKKRLFCFILAFILPFSLILVSCGKSNNNDNIENDWIEVQSITYVLKDGTSISSSISWHTTGWTSITEEEYNNAPYSQKWGNSDYRKMNALIRINRKEFFDNENKSLNYTYYGYKEGFSKIFYKETLSNYEIRYVKVRFLNDDILELNYYDIADGFITIRIKPLSYEITYFND